MIEKTKELRTDDSVVAVLSGWQQGEGSVFSGVAFREAILQLSGEHPDDFPSLFFRDLNGFPYSTELEDILFQLGAWGFLTDDLRENYRISLEKKQVLQRGLKENCSKEEIEHSAVLVQRFTELMRG